MPWKGGGTYYTVDATPSPLSMALLELASNVGQQNEGVLSWAMSELASDVAQRKGAAELACVLAQRDQAGLLTGWDSGNVADPACAEERWASSSACSSSEVSLEPPSLPLSSPSSSMR